MDFVSFDTPTSRLPLEIYLEDESIILGESKVIAAIVCYLNKRGKCVMNISTIINIFENE